MVRFPWGFRLYIRFAYSYLYDAHTHTHTNTHIRTHKHAHTHTHLYNNNIYRIMRRSVRAVPECTQIMSGRAKKAAPRANRSSWQAGTAWQVTWPFRRGGCPSPSCPFHPLFIPFLGVHQTSGVRPCTRPPQPPRDIQYNVLLIY